MTQKCVRRIADVAHARCDNWREGDACVDDETMRTIDVGLMRMNRRILLILVGCLLAATAAHAQNTPTWPTRPVTIFVTAAPGGVTDVVARAVGQRLSQLWGQPVIIENKGGAGHILGAQAVARAAPDGHTLLVAEAATYVLNPSLYARDKLGYDVDRDLVP